MVMLTYDDGEIILESVVKLLADWCVMAEIGELSIDIPDDLDVIMFDIFQVFFL